MLLRIVKVIFGVWFAIALVRSYGDFVQQTGKGNIIMLAFMCLLGVLSLLLAYSGIKNKPFMSYLSRKKRIV